MVFTGLVYIYLYLVYFISIPGIYIYNLYSGDDYLIQLQHNGTYLPINPSIIYSNNEFFGSVRYTNDHKCTKHIEKVYKSEVRLIDNNFTTDKVVDVGKLHWCYHKTFKRRGAEDPRSFIWDNKHFSLITIVGHLPKPCNNKIYLYDHQTYGITRVYTLFNSNDYMEKNWLPFIYHNKLHVEYFVNPRKVFKFVNGQSYKYDITYCRSMYPNLHGSVNPVLINSDFDIKYSVNREILHREIINKGLYSSYEPCMYPGVNIKYYFNNNNDKCGICKCTEKCNGKGRGCGNGQCKRVTIAVFASGKIIITGGRSIEQLVDSYNFIKGVLDDVEKFKMIEEINK